MALFGKIHNEKDEKQARLYDEIKSIKVREETAVSVYQKEIAELQNQKANIISSIGELAYKKYLNSEEITLKTFETHWNQLKDLSNRLEQRNAKQDEIIARYNEEIEILEKELNYLNDTPTTGTSYQFCPNCGTKTKDGDFFCEKCGTKLT